MKRNKTARTLTVAINLLIRVVRDHGKSANEEAKVEAARWLIATDKARANWPNDGWPKRKVKPAPRNPDDHDFHKAMLRPADYHDLHPDRQWDIDKKLGILDYEGGCHHLNEAMCKACKKVYKKRFGLKYLADTGASRF